MALKFLNKKGWHTGSLRNIENVWKAEQKHDAEQRKLEELRKQIHEEREKAEFRQLQEQAGLIPRQERLDFLYESGLAVGKGSSSFKELESLPKTDPGAAASSSSAAAAVEKQQPSASAPGALFEDKPQSANDTWRKLHSDPLLLIRQREQEALARVKNNPVQMAMIRKSVESKKDKSEKKHKTKQRKKSKHKKYSSSENDSDPEDDRRSHKASRNSEEALSEQDDRRKKYSDKDRRPYSKDEKTSKKRDYESRREHFSERRVETRSDMRSYTGSSDKPPRYESNSRHRNTVKLSEEERAARLREMQMDAERHEVQRWKRLKKAAENDAEEAAKDSASLGRNFLDKAHKSVYGAEKGGSSTIEESVRRRLHYLQGKSASESNAFRR